MILTGTPWPREELRGGGLGRSWRRAERFWRLGGLERELGGALGPHEGDEDAGLLNLARGELGTVNFRERDVEFSPAVDSGNGRRRPRRCSSGGEGEPEASTSPGDPGSKQLRACARARDAARTAAALDREPVIPIGSL